jgi:hypothetical protein
MRKLNSTMGQNKLALKVRYVRATGSAISPANQVRRSAGGIVGKTYSWARFFDSPDVIYCIQKVFYSGTLIA